MKMFNTLLIVPMHSFKSDKLVVTIQTQIVTLVFAKLTKDLFIFGKHIANFFPFKLISWQIADKNTTTQ